MVVSVAWGWSPGWGFPVLVGLAGGRGKRQIDARVARVVSVWYE